MESISKRSSSSIPKIILWTSQTSQGFEQNLRKNYYLRFGSHWWIPNKQESFSHHPLCWCEPSTAWGLCTCLKAEKYLSPATKLSELISWLINWLPWEIISCDIFLQTLAVDRQGIPSETVENIKFVVRLLNKLSSDWTDFNFAVAKYAMSWRMTRP